MPIHTTRVMTSGTPAPVNSPFNVRIMDPTFFKTYIDGGMNKFPRLELDIATSAGALISLL